MATNYTFTGVGSADTASNWTPNGIPSRTLSDTVSFTTIPTDGSISAVTFFVPTLAINLSLYSLDVGQFYINGENYNNSSNLTFPSSDSVLASAGQFGFDATGDTSGYAVGNYIEPDQSFYATIGPPYGPSSGFNGTLDMIAYIGSQYITTSAGGDLQENFIMDSGSGSWAGGTLSSDAVLTTESGGNYFEPLVSSVATNSTGYGPSQNTSGTLDASFILTSCTDDFDNVLGSIDPLTVLSNPNTEGELDPKYVINDVDVALNNGLLLKSDVLNTGTGANADGTYDATAAAAEAYNDGHADGASDQLTSDFNEVLAAADAILVSHGNLLGVTPMWDDSNLVDEGNVKDGVTYGVDSEGTLKSGQGINGSEALMMP